MTYNERAFSINLIPKIDEKNSWTGELEVVIVTDKDNPLDSDSYNGMMHLSQLVACSVAYMEEHPSLISDIENFIDELEPEEDSSVSVTHVEDNVVHLNFRTKTKGNA